jgi:Ca-activated chloride channel family protein
VTLPEAEPKNDALSRLWARATIADLERRPRGYVDRDAITRVALAHDLVTAYTSFVAIDSTSRVSNGFPALVRQPSEAPDAVDMGSAGGVVSYGSAPSATPPPSESRHYDAAPMMAYREKRGGCAGCTTSGSSSSDRSVTLSLLGVLALVVARKRRDRD